MELNRKEFLITDDMDFPSFPIDLTREGTIKREELKDEEDMLLFAQLDTLASNMDNSSEYQIIQEVQMMDRMKDPVLSGMTGMNMETNKTPISLRFANEEGTSHFIRYKLLDGKHVKIWECGICGKEFTHQYTLMRHLPTHTDERKFQCNTCGKAFRQMSTLSQHRAIHSTERPYICEICHKTFNRVSTLISHRKTHTGEKPHRCHLCNKSFHQKGNLRNHIFTHTNERPYKCDICEKGFNQMSNLMCHKLKAHQRAEKPKYCCQVCGKHFPKRIGLRHHEQYTHGMINPHSNGPDTVDNNFMEAILVDPIKTEAMRLAIESKQTPFALLRPVCGIPVLVRVMPAGDKQMLVPATAEDLRKHAHISITPKEENDSQKENHGILIIPIIQQPTSFALQLNYSHHLQWPTRMVETSEVLYNSRFLWWPLLSNNVAKVVNFPCLCVVQVRITSTSQIWKLQEIVDTFPQCQIIRLDQEVWWTSET